MSNPDVNEKIQQIEPTSVESDDSKTKNKRKSPLELRRYTKQIWLAGLGAFSRAEEEGNKLFDSLVKVGEELEEKTVDIADNTAEKVGEVTGKAIERVSGTVDKVEKLIDQHTHQTLNRIGIVTPKDIVLLEQLLVNLHRKVDELTESHQKLMLDIEGLKKSEK
ncbi:MAG: poly(hydroxyalcanoate) granule associated protein [Acinetobacter sp.]|jgi:poly(hydroxyalkanoate) granule-associated protein|nr:MAG: poly(hydroxyalcanoate) granule associated protein [Acinetobacter sp.]